MFFKKYFLKKYKEKLKQIKNKHYKILHQEKSKFNSILNHDIKTPILAQNQSLELLLKGSFGTLLEPQKEIIKEIYYSNNFLLEVVLNSIFISKYEIENPKLNLENIDIISQIKDCAQMVKFLAQEKNQNIIIKNKIKSLKLEADRKLIQKIIFNILSTSVFCGFENSDIEISIKENKKSVSFITKNKSIYMTKEKINSLLKDKKTAQDFNQLGLNLNLNIAQKLISAHNWDIIAESKKDNSAIFGFTIKK